jgi:hypothetical protein
MRKYPPKDTNGQTIRIGDTVRIVGMPNLSNMDPEALKETQPVFEYLVGKYKKVQGFDEYGHIELEFQVLKWKDGIHTVWIEPFLLKVKQVKKRKG